MVRRSGATPDRPVAWAGCTEKARSRREHHTWRHAVPIIGCFAGPRRWSGESCHGLVVARCVVNIMLGTSPWYWYAMLPKRDLQK